MRRIDTLIVGGGQAGLATSRCLTERRVEHLVLERGRVGERWRSERWDSLRLLTPNWMSRLPGRSYQGPDPDGFMTREEVVALLDDYARSFAAPVAEETCVRSVAPDAAGEGWRVTTDRGSWRARNVVLASGHCDRPRVPGLAAALSRDVVQVTTDRYRNPAGLPPGGVLVVGASATGAQLADEIVRSGRPVTLAVGAHNRLPRRYRGRDILWWLDRLGSLDRPLADMPDRRAARREPSLQLVGRPGADEPALDLAALAARGVRLAGHLVAADGRRVHFAPDLQRLVAEADERMARVLSRIDRHVAAHGLEDRFPATPHPSRVHLADSGPGELDLATEGISTVLWATGYRRVYPWLHVPVLDAEGEIRHRRGRTPLPGLYAVGLQFMIRRRSTFLDGVGLDAREIADDIAGITQELATAA